MDTETHKTPRNSRASAIELLPLGESVAIARRIDLTFGLSDKERALHTAKVRGILDSQVARVRRKFSDRKFIVENMLVPTERAAGMIFIAVATRIG